VTRSKTSRRRSTRRSTRPRSSRPGRWSAPRSWPRRTFRSFSSHLKEATLPFRFPSDERIVELSRRLNENPSHGSSAKEGDSIFVVEPGGVPDRCAVLCVRRRAIDGDLDPIQRGEDAQAEARRGTRSKSCAIRRRKGDRLLPRRRPDQVARRLSRTRVPRRTWPRKALPPSLPFLASRLFLVGTRSRAVLALFVSTDPILLVPRALPVRLRSVPIGPKGSSSGGSTNG